MVTLFIKMFLDYRKSVIARLNELKLSKQTNTQEYSHLILVLTRVNQMSDYITSGDWARKTTRDKYVFWIRCGYNYVLTANKFKTTEESLRVLVSRADTALSKIMKKPLEHIMSGNVNDGWVEFNFNRNRLDINELFGRPILAATPNPAALNQCYSLDDCKSEIKFMKTYNSYEIRKQLESLDEQKMSYLIALGSLNDPAYLEERKKLIKSVLRLNKDSNA